jgi:hypothetical protein
MMSLDGGHDLADREVGMCASTRTTGDDRASPSAVPDLASPLPNWNRECRLIRPCDRRAVLDARRAQDIVDAPGYGARPAESVARLPPREQRCTDVSIAVQLGASP